MRRVLKGLLYFLGGLIALLLLMQLVPYGRNHTNPPVIKEPDWNSPRTRELAVKACFDCHSNETKWPWYSNVAPLSWVVQRHVDVGRTVLNFSDWTRDWEHAKGQAPANVILEDMPLASYKFLHPESKLSHDEKVELAKGLAETFGLRWRD